MQTATVDELQDATAALSDAQILAQFEWVAVSLAKHLSEHDKSIRADLQQIGLAALIETGRTWRPGKQALSSFVYPRVKGAMIDFLRQEGALSKSVSLDDSSPPSSDGELHLQRRASSLQCEQETAEEALTREEQKYLLSQALEALPARERELLLLKFYENASNETIAVSLGVHRETVRRSVQSALELLKSKMEELGAL